DHRPAIIEADRKRVEARVFSVVRVPAIDAVFAQILRALRRRPDLAFSDTRVLGQSEFDHDQFPKGFSRVWRLSRRSRFLPEIKRGDPCRSCAAGEQMAGPPSRASRPLFRIKLRIDLPKHAQRIPSASPLIIALSTRAPSAR